MVEGCLIFSSCCTCPWRCYGGLLDWFYVTTSTVLPCAININGVVTSANCPLCNIRCRFVVGLEPTSKHVPLLSTPHVVAVKDFLRGSTVLSCAISDTRLDVVATCPLFDTRCPPVRCGWVSTYSWDRPHFDYSLVVATEDFLRGSTFLPCAINTNEVAVSNGKVGGKVCGCD